MICLYAKIAYVFPSVLIQSVLVMVLKLNILFMFLFKFRNVARNVCQGGLSPRPGG